MPAARQERVDTDFATLLRGEDRYGHFQPEAAPEATMHPDAVVEHQRIADIQGQIYLSGTERAGVSGLIETNEALAHPSRRRSRASQDAVKVG